MKQTKPVIGNYYEIITILKKKITIIVIFSQNSDYEQKNHIFGKRLIKKITIVKFTIFLTIKNFLQMVYHFSLETTH